jgi:hypothetical protein
MEFVVVNVSAVFTYVVLLRRKNVRVVLNTFIIIAIGIIMIDILFVITYVNNTIVHVVVVVVVVVVAVWFVFLVNADVFYKGCTVNRKGNYFFQ